MVSVLPRALSRWLALGLPSRLRRTIDLPVIQVDAQPLSISLPPRRDEPAVAA